MIRTANPVPGTTVPAPRKFSAALSRAGAVGLAGAFACALVVSSGTALAETWPTRPISLIVPFPPGGTTDVLARTLAEKLAPVLGQPVVVENKPGAGATLGADLVARAKPDGHTLLMGAVHHTIATSVYRKLPYDFRKDFAPITTVALVPNVLVVNASSPARSVADLVALAKTQQGKLSYGSNGNGTAQHLIGTQFQNATGAQLIHVPYKGSGPLTADLLGEQITMSFDTITPVLPHIKSGKLRALGVTTGRRAGVLPDVPTLQEAGLKEFDIGTWFGVLAPAATPAPILERLNDETVKVIRSPEFRQKMAEIGAEPIGNTREEMGRQIREETDKFARIAREANVVIE